LATRRAGKVALVALDGFTPDPDQLKRPLTQVWGAKSGRATSRNFPWGVAGAKTYAAAKNCTDEWPLHFSLVNSAANNTDTQTIADGYKKCVANLAWLK
jgi:hypothetical protein